MSIASLICHIYLSRLQQLKEAKNVASPIPKRAKTYAIWRYRYCCAKRSLLFPNYKCRCSCIRNGVGGWPLTEATVAASASRVVNVQSLQCQNPPPMEGGVVRWWGDVYFNGCDGTAELDHLEGKMDNHFHS